MEILIDRGKRRSVATKQFRSFFRIAPRFLNARIFCSAENVAGHAVPWIDRWLALTYPLACGVIPDGGAERGHSAASRSLASSALA